MLTIGTSQPLMGVEQSTCGVAPLPTLTPSPAVTDITENMRAKIYALCCKMGEGMFILTDFKLLLNTCSYFACACVGFQYTMEGLPTEDRVTLCIVESYLDFKVTTVCTCACELARRVIVLHWNVLLTHISLTTPKISLYIYKTCTFNYLYCTLWYVSHYMCIVLCTVWWGVVWGGWGAGSGGTETSHPRPGVPHQHPPDTRGEGRGDTQNTGEWVGWA